MEETKEKKIEGAFAKLVSNLEDLTKIYRTLLDLIRKEKDLLINSDLEALNENNKAKEALIYKLRAQDSARERYARELANLIGADVKQPRLLELAQRLEGAAGDRLRAIHSTLEILIRRVSEINKENETYTQSALNTLNGAMGEIKETLAPKKTYGSQGKMAHGPEKAGNFVSKEA
jgi:hypothetical protein